MNQDNIPIPEASGDPGQSVGGSEQAASTGDLEPAIAQGRGRLGEEPKRFLSYRIRKFTLKKRPQLDPPWDDHDASVNEVYSCCLDSPLIAPSGDSGEAIQAMEDAFRATRSHTLAAERTRDEMTRQARNFVERATSRRKHDGSDLPANIGLDRVAMQPQSTGIEPCEWERMVRELLECLQGREDLRAIATDLLRDVPKDRIAAGLGVSVKTIERRMQELGRILIKVLGRYDYSRGRNADPSPETGDDLQELYNDDT